MKYRVLLFLVLALAFGCQQKKLSEERYANIQMNNGEIKKVYYIENEGYAIAEGDIAIASLNEVKRIGAISISSKNGLWERGRVPYLINSKMVKTERVITAIKEIEKNTNIRFVEQSDEKDYIHFQSTKEGCFSFVGRRGGEQIINVEAGCSTGNTIHEIFHALGIWHEQSREDRDQHIKIIWDNIEKSEIHNFDQKLNDGNDVGEYDFSSIMHYGAFFFSKNGKATIEKLDGSTDGFGTRAGMSNGDIGALNKLYQN